MDPQTKFGIELHRADKGPAPMTALADTVDIDSETGELKLGGYRGDALGNTADDLFLRFVVERPGPDGEPTKFASQPIPVKTLTKANEPVPG